MLTETKMTRQRTSVSQVTPNGDICCAIYPTIDSKKCFCLKKGIQSNGIDMAKLGVGMPFDLLMAGGEVVAIDEPAVHPFDLKKLYPDGLECVVARIDSAAEGVYGAVTAKYASRGSETLYRITSLTKMFQAQADDDAREKIYRGLKKGDSVNIWVDPSAPIGITGEYEPKVVRDVVALSVNYR